jgi:DNA-directed RNA polymerase subunit RPC12/RpoP
MTVTKDGYICAVCGPVEARLSWSDEENDTVATCTKCGATIQRVIPAQPFSTPMFAQKLGHRGGPGLDTGSNSPRILAPATPTEEDTT